MNDRNISPWLRGIVDTLTGAEIMRKSAIPNRNRLAVILIDSAFETACWAFLRHKAKIQLQDSHRQRENLVKTVKAKLHHIDDEVWDNINFYYQDIRCDFYHQSAGKTIPDVTLLDYKDTVEFVIDEAFGIQISALVEAELAKAEKESSVAPAGAELFGNIRIPEVSGKVNKLLVAVAATAPSDANAVNEFFKREGDPLRLKPPEFRRIVAQNSGSKKYFYYDHDQKVWILSGLGRFKLSQLSKGDSDVE
jgi:hypothetical protein